MLTMEWNTTMQLNNVMQPHFPSFRYNNYILYLLICGLVFHIYLLDIKRVCQEERELLHRSIPLIHPTFKSLIKIERICNLHSNVLVDMTPKSTLKTMS